VEAVNKDLFNIYPNPNNGSFHILFNGINEGIVRISDAQGRVVYENTFMEKAGINVQLPKVGKGLYTVQVYGKEEYTVKRVVVE
ncbi:T9SS type A sorting domain-containing protein, partial [Lishizhenia sp.]|uniref:T9SS type A sorting domain-containing protein n=1 Tax=Lishizhenia sp. TaxID=2497594 RepID=UPI00299EC1A1